MSTVNTVVTVDRNPARMSKPAKLKIFWRSWGHTSSDFRRFFEKVATPPRVAAPSKKKIRNSRTALNFRKFVAALIFCPALTFENSSPP